MKTININGKDFTIEELNKLIEDFENIPQYPIYCQHLHSDKIVKFTDLQEGIVVKNSLNTTDTDCVGQGSNMWVEHTHKNTWQSIPVCPKTGFFHGQLVWAWDNQHTHFKALVFYNAKHDLTFALNGGNYSLRYENYLPFEGNWPDWALEAYKTLEL